MGGRGALDHRGKSSHVVEARAAEERWAAEVKEREEERSRAQAEALRQQKLLAALEAKRKAEEVASGSGLGRRGVRKMSGPQRRERRLSGPHATVAQRGGSYAR